MNRTERLNKLATDLDAAILDWTGDLSAVEVEVRGIVIGGAMFARALAAESSAVPDEPPPNPDPPPKDPDPDQPA